MGLTYSFPSHPSIDKNCVHGMKIYIVNGVEKNVCVKCKDNYVPMVKDHHPQPKPYAKGLMTR